MLPAKNLLIDLNSIACYFGVPTNKGASNEHGQNYFFSSDGIPAFVRISKMCYALQRRLQDSKLFMHGSIFVHGLCTIDLSRKFTRHRIMFAIHAIKTLSHGYSWSNIKKHVSRCQRKSRLAY